MLKVFFITRKWPPAIGGMETYSVRLVHELNRLTNLSLLCLPGRDNGKPPYVWTLMFFMFKCGWRLTRQKETDVVHVGDLVMWPLAYLAQLILPNVQTVITAYGLDIVYGARKGVLPKIYKIYLALGVRLCKKRLRVIAISNATAALCRSVGFTDVVVVPLGVKLTHDIEHIVNVLPHPYVLYVGRLVKRKGCSWFARNVLPALDVNIRLVVVGKAWDASELQEISNNPRIEYKRNVTDSELAVLRREALAVIMPNISTGGVDVEGFGLTALEAGADGGVLLASGIEGIVDAVIDGETGFLLPSEDVSAWTKKILEIKDWSIAKRTDFIRNAQLKIQERYSWGRVANDTVNSYLT